MGGSASSGLVGFLIRTTVPGAGVPGALVFWAIFGDCLALAAKVETP
jgi:hypothetical protein